MDTYVASKGRAICVGIALAAALAVGWPGHGFAASMAMVTSHPEANQTIDGHRASITLTFDKPVDHASSRLTLVGPSATRVLKARLSSRPNTVFTPAGDLAQGHYVLQWHVREQGGEMVNGELPFEVGKKE